MELAKRKGDMGDFFLKEVSVKIFTHIVMQTFHIVS